MAVASGCAGNFILLAWVSGDGGTHEMDAGTKISLPALHFSQILDNTLPHREYPCIVGACANVFGLYL